MSSENDKRNKNAAHTLSNEELKAFDTLRQSEIKDSLAQQKARAVEGDNKTEMNLKQSVHQLRSQQEMEALSSRIQLKIAEIDAEVESLKPQLKKEFDENFNANFEKAAKTYDRIQSMLYELMMFVTQFGKMIKLDISLYRKIEKVLFQLGYTLGDKIEKLITSKGHLDLQLSMKVDDQGHLIAKAVVDGKDLMELDEQLDRDFQTVVVNLLAQHGYKYDYKTNILSDKNGVPFTAEKFDREVLKKGLILQDDNFIEEVASSLNYK